jgi:para-aminobenzoate synthetase/4-amino-4-deoxychorismate lyase
MLSPPFVLLDDARPGGAGARLYQAPVRVVAAGRVEEVRPALAALRAARDEGLHAAGWIGYEAGAALVDRAPLPTAGPTGPLLWFGLFDRYRVVSDGEVAALLGDPAGARALPPRPLIGRADYDARLALVLALIAAGDLYQANLTFQAEVALLGPVPALYARLRQASAAAHGALIDTGERQLLSLSPELFVTLDGDRLACRPMKGTAPRGDTSEEDRTLAAMLAQDDKQRAENLMIVDLMRNDLARVATPGSVAVPALYTVETYPTIHQMTSSIAASLAPGRDAIDVIEALFPCGSITGAPKTRAMQVIADVEGAPRGAYCGAVGRLDADGGAAFNVAIRTITVATDRATIGLGSGIVADSRADAEWAEALAKGAFVTAGQRTVDLIETMAFDPDAGILLLERHLARLKTSAAALGFAFDRHATRNDLQAATFRLREPARVRLILGPSGAVAIEVSPPPPPPAEPMAVAVVPLPVDPRDWRLAHKTSDRGFYDAARAAAGTGEVVFERADGRLTEGSFTSLFVADADGRLLTPPLGDGLLSGVLRAELIEARRAVEAPLTRADLADGFLLGNALRGLFPARLAVAPPDPPR